VLGPEGVVPAPADGNERSPAYIFAVGFVGNENVYSNDIAVSRVWPGQDEFGVGRSRGRGRQVSRPGKKRELTLGTGSRANDATISLKQAAALVKEYL